MHLSLRLHGPRVSDNCLTCRLFFHHVARLAVVCGIVAAASGAHAGPWIAPGDTRLRNDIERLADVGVIRAPVTTWPLSWGDIAGDVLDGAEPATLSARDRSALYRVRRLARAAIDANEPRTGLRLATGVEPRQLRTFADTPRESGEVSAAVEWTGLRFSYRLEATAVSGADDGKSVRPDGTYVGMALGNVMIAAGYMDRWWGPGREGSLLLSSNARPIPSLSLRRNYSEAPRSRWLRWIGPWTASLVTGLLEGSRDVPDAVFMGLRFNFRPTPDLELGVSRTAMWCGDGRACDFCTFLDLAIGKDNRGDDGVSIEDEAGNQLAGLDWRWISPVGDGPWSFYGQVVGEDEAGGFPSRYIAQLGLGTWGDIEALASSYRAHVEVTDTAAEFYKSETRFDYAYEHGIYTTGYRYRGRSIGHAMDNDGRMVSVGVALMTDREHGWDVLLRHSELNRGGLPTGTNTVADAPTDVLNIEIEHRRPMASGRLDVGLGYDHIDVEGESGANTEIRAWAQWQRSL